MRLDLAGTVAPKPALAVGEQPANQRGRLGGQLGFGREDERLMMTQDLTTGHEGVVAVEWRVSDEHLKQHDAERPPVAVGAVSCFEEDLGGHVVGRAHRAPDQRLAVAIPSRHALAARHALPRAGADARRPERNARLRGFHLGHGVARWPARRRRRHRRRAARRVELESHGCEALDEAKVSQLDVPVGVDEEIVRLDVAVDVGELVERLDRQHRLRHVEARLLLRQNVALHEQRHQVAARHVLHHEVQEVVVAEGVVELDHPRVGIIDCRHHV
mmetsp:Transcript_13027/g.33390  ORF Transcript_13027/g.33390 Transcript_13027/m.33390 type:complete len:273 (-) Transcript_13027:384-1202(-)